MVTVFFLLFQFSGISRQKFKEQSTGASAVWFYDVADVIEGEAAGIVDCTPHHADLTSALVLGSRWESVF